MGAYESLSEYECVSAGGHEDFLGTGVTGGCEMLGTGTRTKFRSSVKTMCALNPNYLSNPNLEILKSEMGDRLLQECANL